MKRLLIVCILCVIGGCTNTYDYDKATSRVAEDKDSTSRYTSGALTVEPHLVGYLWDDVDFVYEYGRIYRPNKNTGFINNNNVRRYKGITTNTHLSENVGREWSPASSTSSLVEKAIAAEVASKATFWIAKEIERESDSRGIFESTYDFFKTWRSSPYEATLDLPQDNIFYFPDGRSDKATLFSDALIQAGYSKEETTEIIKRCSEVTGWGYLRPENNPLRHLKNGPEKAKEKFYKKCYRHISSVASKGETDEIIVPFVKEEFALNPYVTNRYFTPNKIKRQGERRISEVYDTGMVEHFRGKFGKEIKEELHRGLKTSVYKNVLVLIPANPLEFSNAKAARKFHEKRNLPGLNFYPIHKDLFKTELSGKEWTAETLDKLLNKRDSKGHYNNQYTRGDYINSWSKDTRLTIRDGLYQLGGTCNLDRNEVQYAKMFTSRFVYDCENTSYFNKTIYPQKLNGDMYPKGVKNRFTSKLIATSFKTGHMIQSSIPGSYEHQTMILDFKLTGKSISDAIKHNCPEPCQKRNPLQPDSEVVTQFAMTLAHDLPPWVYISWLSKGNKGYVLHKYTLYEFDLTELYNKPH